MAGGQKVDILILCGAGRVGRYHVSPVWLDLLWIGPLVLILLLAGALAVAWQARQETAKIGAEAARLAVERQGVGERLLRLENIEQVLRAKDAGQLETLLASVHADDPNWWKPQAGDASAQPNLSRLLARVDTNQAGVENLRARFDNRKLQLNFDLSNLSAQASLTGRGEVVLLGNDATLTPLKPDRDELAFQAQRSKQIAVSLPLPAKLDTRELYGLRLTLLDPAGKTLFSQVFPLPKD